MGEPPTETSEVNQPPPQESEIQPEFKFLAHADTGEAIKAQNPQGQLQPIQLTDSAKKGDFVRFINEAGGNTFAKVTTLSPTATKAISKGAIGISLGGQNRPLKLDEIIAVHRLTPNEMPALRRGLQAATQPNQGPVVTRMAPTIYDLTEANSKAPAAALRATRPVPPGQIKL